MWGSLKMGFQESIKLLIQRPASLYIQDSNFSKYTICKHKICTANYETVQSYLTMEDNKMRKEVGKGKE